MDDVQKKPLVLLSTVGVHSSLVASGNLSGEHACLAKDGDTALAYLGDSSLMPIGNILRFAPGSTTLTIRIPNRSFT